MAENWHGLVVGNYNAVMALPWKKKFGIRYVYTPAFIQQLGLIGYADQINWKEIIEAIKKFISFADIHFNFLNTTIQEHIIVTTRTNLIIDLNQPLETIRSRYKNDLKENIKKAETQNCRYTHAEIYEAISVYYLQYGERMSHIKNEDYNRFIQLCELLQSKGQCFVREVVNETGNVLATALFLKDDKRIYNLVNTTLPDGRDKEANHSLLDNVIAEFSGQSLLFDFEGSELPGVRAFYEKFGAVTQPYFYYHYNGLPWPLRILKR